MADTSRRAGKKQVADTGPQFFQHVNSTEIAAILIGKLDSFLFSSPEIAFQYANPDELDPIKFGAELDAMFSPEDLNELMSTELGQGIMLGMYLVRAMHAAADELEQLQEESDYYGQEE